MQKGLIRKLLLYLHIRRRIAQALLSGISKAEAKVLNICYPKLILPILQISISINIICLFFWIHKVEYINWLNNDADIIIKERTDLYQYEIDNEIVKIQNPCHDDRLAAHSEIRALDQALAARRELGYTVNEETLKELYLYNIDLTELYKNNIIIPKPRCENCSRLTDGINTVIHN